MISLILGLAAVQERAATPVVPVPVGVADVATVPGAEACAVALDDGRLVRVDLETGVPTAESAGSGPESPPANLERTAGDVLVSWSGYRGGRFVVRSWDDLRELHAVELSGDHTVSAWSPDGRRVVLRPHVGRRASTEPWVLVAPDLPGQVVLGATVAAAAFSPDGARLVVVDDAKGELWDSGTGELLASFPLLNDEHDAEAGAGSCRAQTLRVTFHGAERIVVGWSIEDNDDDVWAAGFDVFTVTREGVQPEARIRCASAFADYVDALRSDAELGRISISHGASGYVHVYDDSDWSRVWSMDYGGGNGNVMRLNRAGHPRWMAVSGMMPGYSRLVHLETGAEVVAPEVVEGLFDLAPSDSGRSLVGIENAVLKGIDTASRELRFALTFLEHGEKLERGLAYR